MMIPHDAPTHGKGRAVGGASHAGGWPEAPQTFAGAAGKPRTSLLELPRRCGVGGFSGAKL